ncbi:hypothetical protein [Pseudanabaena sp. ABRG5-3]|uniref:hypothetical protein n=1 Tax=Pseudanabaena sp. ABRG5-3 TaxID=685565 RepID=UPI000DC7072C|nr:hypothetical protein [Pseudanabaena sp. ABRG5-3]BBC24594.1 hypothetical protein ABRG53_2337 [Pseudanabaena sp. ABRG5-3]
MATTRPEKPEKRLRKKKKPPKKFRLSYSLLLLLAMVVVGSIAGLVAYRFGKQALEGVNPSPAGIKLPKVSPSPKPKDSPKSPSSQDGKTSFFLDENEVIADMKSRSQQELGGLTRPTYVAKANISDRKKIYTRVDRAYNAIREPLAISANADERIAERIALLRKTVYSRTRSYEYESELALNQPIANNASTSMPLLSTPVEIDSIRSRWEDRYTPSGSSSKNDMQISPKSTSRVFIPEQQPYSAGVNRR